MTALQPRIHALRNSQHLPLGGKAKGLARLMAIPLNVPDGFVIEQAAIGQYPDGLADHYQQLGGGMVAVRSSALGEDAAQHSFAGQFATLLNIRGESALKAAIDDCVASLNSERASAYQQDQTGAASESVMCVVVQNMVDATAAGVLFTADPVSGRHDRLVIDAVNGLGESLVSGEASSDSYVLDSAGQVIQRALINDQAVLTDEQCCELARQARYAARVLGEPLDMEWAIDRNGELFWLQARPITTIGSDLNALDSPVPDDHVLTRCNVGEIFPGPCCPLTYSVVCRAIDISMQYMSAAFCGKPLQQEKAFDQFRYVAGHTFIDLTANIAAAEYTVLARADTAAQSVCGRFIEQLKEPENKKNLLRRLWGIKDFMAYILPARKINADFARQLKTFYLNYHHNSLSMLQELEEKQRWMVDVCRVHLRSSALSGTLEGVVQAIISKGKTPPTLEQQAQAAKLFAGADQVESAMLVQQLDAVIDLIAAHPQGKQQFHDVEKHKALLWLQSGASGAAGTAFMIFLQQHGHRAYKELCLLTPSWADAPDVLVESMQAALMARYQQKTPLSHTAVDLHSQPWLLRYLLPKAHDAIRGREYSKSMMVKVTHILKQGYRHLGQLLQQEGKLPQADSLYFLTLEELGELVRGQQTQLAETAEKRRIAYRFQQRLHFDDIAVGKPQPREQTTQALSDGQLAGRPVSKGVVEGTARVANTLAEAAQLQPGEILIAPVTDVGWTPYFSLIAGLATDVGSAVSHGAVIAREYGLPCVVNLQVATRVFKTGDYIRLDAELGVVTLLERAEA